MAASDHPYARFCDGASRRLSVIFPVEWRKQQDEEKASDELKDALRFTGLGLQPHQVSMGGWASVFISLGAGLVWTTTLLLMESRGMLGFTMSSVIFYGIIPAILLPLILMGWMVNYPKVLAKRQRTATLGRLPEVINYMAMSMRLNPALDRAIEFASENVGEPLGSSLRKVLWDVYMREHDTVEQAFMAFAEEWGSEEDFEEFKRALYGVRASQLESTDEGRERALDKASETITLGTRQRIEEYANTLSGPSMVIFGVGVMLPLILGAMLPLSSMMSGGGGVGLFEMIILFDFVFPVVTLIYSWNVLGNRPGTTPPPDIPDERSRRSRMTALVMAFVLGVVLFGLTLMIWVHGGGVADEEQAAWRYLFALSLLFVPTVPASILLLSGSIPRMGRREEVLAIETEFPDALFQLGSRIAEGRPVERAIRDVGDSFGNESPTGRLFKQLGYVLLITSASLKDALFGVDGVLRDHPSRTVRATMRTVIEVSGKDSLTAGRTIMGVSNYLRELRSVEKDVRIKLGDTMGMMEVTGRIFAPLVLGVTGAIFFLVAGIAGDVSFSTTTTERGADSGTELAFEAWQFILVLGIYLCALVGITSYFTAGIKSGEDWLERRHALGVSLVMAVTVFSLTAWFAQSMIGG
jgi:Flp pilus assembly protein TadB